MVVKSLISVAAIAAVTGLAASVASASITIPTVPIGNPGNAADPFALCRPSMAAFDMGGNVSDWNEAINASDRGLRGGSFTDSGSNLRAVNRIYPLPDERVPRRRVSCLPDPRAIVGRAAGDRCAGSAASPALSGPHAVGFASSILE